jgi:hypothetical protein
VPSLNPLETRLAVEVEDHPLDSILRPTSISVRWSRPPGSAIA